MSENQNNKAKEKKYRGGTQFCTLASSVAGYLGASDEEMKIICGYVNAHKKTVCLNFILRLYGDNLDQSPQFKIDKHNQTNVSHYRNALYKLKTFLSLLRSEKPITFKEKLENPELGYEDIITKLREEEGFYVLSLVHGEDLSLPGYDLVLSEKQKKIYNGLLDKAKSYLNEMNKVASLQEHLGLNDEKWSKYKDFLSQNEILHALLTPSFGSNLDGKGTLNSNLKNALVHLQLWHGKNLINISRCPLVLWPFAKKNLQDTKQILNYQKLFGPSLEEELNISAFLSDLPNSIFQVQTACSNIHSCIESSSLNIYSYLGLDPADEVLVDAINCSLDTDKQKARQFRDVFGEDLKSSVQGDVRPLLKSLASLKKVCLSAKNYLNKTITEQYGISSYFLESFKKELKGIWLSSTQDLYGENLDLPFNANPYFQMDARIRGRLPGFLTSIAAKVNTDKENQISNLQSQEGVTLAAYNYPIFQSAINVVPLEYRYILSLFFGVQDGICHSVEELCTIFNKPESDIVYAILRGRIFFDEIVSAYEKAYERQFPTVEELEAGITKN